MPATQSPAEFLAALLWSLTGLVASRTGWGLPLPLIGAIVDRLRGINQRLARLTARLAAGTYVPRRRRASPRAPAAPRPHTPDGLPRRRGWLLTILPEAISQHGQLEHLFRDPEMVALMQAAPQAMARPLRSLCRMLGVTPPPVLAPPARPKPPRAAPAKRPPPAPPSAAPPTPGRQPAPPRRTRPRRPRICGPPRPA